MVDYSIAQGVRVSSNSWGMFVDKGPDPNITQALLKAAANNNLLIISASGNEGINSDAGVRSDAVHEGGTPGPPYYVGSSTPGGPPYTQLSHNLPCANHAEVDC